MRWTPSARRILCGLLFGPLAGPVVAGGQVTRADYTLAEGLRGKYQYLAVGLAGVGHVDRQDVAILLPEVGCGRASVRGDGRGTREKRPVFDYARLAAALSTATGQSYTATRLPFTAFTFSRTSGGCDFSVGQERWRCTLADTEIREEEPPPVRPGSLRGVSGPVRDADRQREEARVRRPTGSGKPVSQLQPGRSAGRRRQADAR